MLELLKKKTLLNLSKKHKFPLIKFLDFSLPLKDLLFLTISWFVAR